MSIYFLTSEFFVEMEATSENLAIKITQLEMTMAKTNTVLQSAKLEAIERQYATLKSITANVERMRIEVEAKKLADKEEMPEIQEWNAALDAKLEKADDEVRSVREWLDEKKKEADVQAQEEKFQFEEKLHKTK